jgi:transposase
VRGREITGTGVGEERPVAACPAAYSGGAQSGPLPARDNGLIRGAGYAHRECGPRHNSNDFIGFLKKPDKECEQGKELHIIVDNYAAHKPEESKKYLEGRSQRFVLLFIPTHSSWLNMAERRFGELTNKRIWRESRESVKQLLEAIMLCILFMYSS